jgi:hypothetical protein
MKYFIVLNGDKIGPLSFEETLDYNITRETLIWKEGLTDWQPTAALGEYEEYFTNIPPSLPQNEERNYSKWGLNFGFLNILGFVLISTLVFFVLYFYSNFPDSVILSQKNGESIQNISTESDGVSFDSLKYNPHKTSPPNLDRIAEQYSSGRSLKGTENNKSYNNSAEQSSENLLDEIAEQYKSADKITRSGRSNVREGDVSQYDEGFNPMYADQNKYRKEKFQEDIKEKSFLLVIVMVLFFTLIFSWIYFMKNK